MAIFEYAIVYTDAKQRVNMSPSSNKLVERILEQLQVSTRKAEVIFAQFYFGHIAKLHSVSSYLNGRMCCCPCRMRVTNDVERYVLRCPNRRTSRLAELPPLRHRAVMTVEQILSKWSQKVLAFLGSEGFFEESLVPRRN